MKKLLSALLVLVLLVSGLLSLAGCDDKPESTADVTDTATTLGDTTTAAETESPETGVTYTAGHKSLLTFYLLYDVVLFNEDRYTVVINGDSAEITYDFYETDLTESGKEFSEKLGVRFVCSVIESGEYYEFHVTAAYQAVKIVGEGAEEGLRQRLARVEEELADPDLDDEDRMFYEESKELLNGKEIDRSEALAGVEAVLKCKIDEDGNLSEALIYMNGELSEEMYCTYDEAGNLLSSTNGVANQSSEREETTYYANGKPKSYIKYRLRGTEERITSAYYFDESGNLIEEQ